MVVVLQRLDWPATWEEAEIFARRLTDRLGCPIDAGIRETVIALNLLGFQTSQSCEGHLERGHPYPWVDFDTGECPAWYEQAQEESCREGQSVAEKEAAISRLMDLVAAYHHENHLYTRLSALLDAFYASRTNGADGWRILLHCIYPGYYRLLPDCGYAAEEWPPNLRAKNLARSQAEMREFTAFLKQHFSAHEITENLHRGPISRI